jgi:regulator of cell morphogenesis and NO signaling
MERCLTKQTILEIVDNNFVHASVLHFFGIQFYLHPSATLPEICEKKGLDVQKIVLQLNRSHSFQFPYPHLENFCELSVESLIDYLRQTHRRYIRHKLPYMADLVKNICVECFDDADLARDLKFVFPLFMEDFIHHIKEEEQQLFGFILRLSKASKGKFSLIKMFFELQEKSLDRFHTHHQEDDDEMAGIRALTNDYHISSKTGTYTKVVFSELQSFEQDLKAHSHLENHILFPKAFVLEKKVCHWIDKKAKRN